jgi:hypothetical protein
VLTPEQRVLRARIAADTRWSTEDPKDPDGPLARTRAKSPGSLDFWKAKLDPDGALPEAERERRAEHARRAHMTRLSLASSQARSRKKVSPNA